MIKFKFVHFNDNKLNYGEFIKEEFSYLFDYTKVKLMDFFSSSDIDDNYETLIIFNADFFASGDIGDILNSEFKELSSYKNSYLVYNNNDFVLAMINSKDEEYYNIFNQSETCKSELETLLNELIKNDIATVKLNEDRFLSLSDSRSFSDANDIYNSEVLSKLIDSGVFILDSDSVTISHKSKVKAGSIICAGAQILGDSFIDSGVYIGRNSLIKDSHIFKGVKIDGASRIISSIVQNGSYILSSTLTDSEVGENSKIGPYAQLRPNSVLEKNVKIGDFVEVKNSKIGENSKVSHLSYIGDSDLGKNINVGCGVVFVNYNGKNKFRTIVEDNVFIGCNVNLVAPVKIGKGAFLAAGSTITQNVEAEQLSIARSRQTNKDGWKLK